MANHAFSFAGGELLSKMGASWFVSYAYYKYIDPTHLNWQNVSPKSCKSRSSNFNRSTIYHNAWLNEVLKMEAKNLSKNRIGLLAKEVIDMAKELLSRISL